ncbi:SRPBCC domain-containing protein [Streptomyces physcomitrii]|uniref:SRPBCC family protein n=1 Tax=Streptomyces physcomitrii TaxID=2724184 RepID=UPI003406209B
MSEPEHRRFEIRRSFAVDATPEQVWAALTEGGAGWLRPFAYEPRAGGAAPCGGTVVTWDPPRQLTCTTGGLGLWDSGSWASGSGDPGSWDSRSGDSGSRDSRTEDSGSRDPRPPDPRTPPVPMPPPGRLDHCIEARDGGRRSCVWYVHTGRLAVAPPRRNVLIGTPGTPDEQLESLARRTDFALHTLREYLVHFPGRPATFTALPAPRRAARTPADPAAPAPGTLARMVRALGLPEDAAQGARVRATGPEGQELDALVDFRDPYFLGLRTDEALYRFCGSDHPGGPAGLTVHDFASGADAKGTELAWRNWFSQLFG